MNYQALPRETKAEVKPLVQEIRKLLYEKDQANLLKDGLIINFGKGTEERNTVKVQVLT